MSPRHLVLCASIAISGLLHATEPQAIGVRFSLGEERSLTPTEVAGAPGVRVSHWNNWQGPQRDMPAVDLTNVTNSKGEIVKGLAFALKTGAFGGTARRATAKGNDSTLFSCPIDLYGGTPTTVTASNIPYAVYDVYVYAFGETSNRSGQVSVNGRSLWLLTNFKNPAADGTGYVEGTTAVTPSRWGVIEPANYVKFSGVTGSKLVITLQTGPAEDVLRFKVCGFEIVDASSKPPAR